MYVDHYVAGHVTSVFIGVEELADLRDSAEKERLIGLFVEGYKQAKRMIIEESGVHAINKHFRLISHSRPSSAFIQRAKEIEKTPQ